MKRRVLLLLLVLLLIPTICFSALFTQSNFAVSSLAGGITNAGTSVTLATGTGALFPQTGTFVAVMWAAAYASPIADSARELVTVTLSAGDVFTITRAQEGTSAKAWSLGDHFALVVTAAVLNQFAPSASSTLTSPTMTGTVTMSGASTVTVPTVTTSDSSTNSASTAFVKAQGYGTGTSTYPGTARSTYLYKTAGGMITTLSTFYTTFCGFDASENSCYAACDDTCPGAGGVSCSNISPIYCTNTGIGYLTN